MTATRNNLQNRITDAALTAGRLGVTAPELKVLFANKQGKDLAEHPIGPRIASIQAAVFSLCKSHTLVSAEWSRGGATVYLHSSHAKRASSEPTTQAAKDRAEIYAMRPLVSVPKVAPLRPIPAWSRQPL